MARQTAQSVVALGGGHGLYATLSALRHLLDDLTVDEITAVVTVADDGGSSGRLRQEFGVLPPGDLRMALAALCNDDEWGRTWAEVVQHRFAGDGEMNGHVVGNLLIVSLWELMGDHVRALDWVGRLLGARGRVLPMAVTPIEMTAQVRDSTGHTSLVRGQATVATTDGEIVSVALDPAQPEACKEAVEAILAAEYVVLGPGSWYTSVIPHLLVPEMRTALEETSARVLVVLNLERQAETGSMTAADHLRVLLQHAPHLSIDTVVADRASVDDPTGLQLYVESLGASLLLSDVAVPDGSPRHDDVRLAEAFAVLMAT